MGKRFLRGCRCCDICRPVRSGLGCANHRKTRPRYRFTKYRRRNVHVWTSNVLRRRRLLTPIARALTQEAIDAAVILNALGALTFGHKAGRQKMPLTAATTLRADHERLETVLDRLREIADGLDQADAAPAATLIFEADQSVARRIVEHEREDESAVYPRVAVLGRPPWIGGHEQGRTGKLSTSRAFCKGWRRGYQQRTLIVF